MKKKNKVLIILSILILGIIFYGSKSGWFAFTISGFTPIFCNDYSFTCCAEVLSYTQHFTVDSYDSFVCPSSATRCVVKVVSSPYSIFIGSKNCKYEWHWSDLGYSWRCDDEQEIKGTESREFTIYPGWQVYGKPGIVPANLQIKVYREELRFYGRAGGMGPPEQPGGYPVSGADGCSFNPTATYKNGKLVKYDISATSYVVKQGECVMNWVSGDRHICGYVEESCRSDKDCGGHTYGNYECSGRTLQKYGCREFSKPYYLEKYGIGYAFKPFEISDEESKVDSLKTLSRCEIVESIPVQCCGDNDCGPNAFCDVGNTWTCKETVECVNDEDCGVSLQCDFANKQLKKPVCSLGKCTWQILQNIECCSSKDCPSGYFCDENYKCKEGIISKKECPFECCEDEELYFDKSCPSDKPYCINNVCNEEYVPDKFCQNCDDYALSKLIGGIWKEKSCKPKFLHSYTFCFLSFIKFLLLPIIFIFSLLFGKQLFSELEATSKNEPLQWILSAIISGIIAYLVFVMFWIGLLLFIGYIMARFSIKYIKR